MFDVEPAISSNTTCSIYLKISTTTNRVSTIQNMGGQKIYGKAGNPSEPLPFQGLYVTEHGENNYYQKGFGAENPRMKHNPNKFTMLLKKAYKILNSRPLSPVLRDDFSLYDLCWSAGRLKNGEPSTRIRRYPVRLHRMFENMLSHRNIKIMLNTDYRRLLALYRTGRWFTPDQLMNSSITATESYRTALWVQAWNAQHARASTSGSRELSQWAFVYPRNGVQIPDRTRTPKTSIVYEYPWVGRPLLPVPRSENAELYKKNKALADATRGAFRRVAGNIQVLQHGPSGSSDPNALHKACGTRASNGSHRKMAIWVGASLVRRFTEQRSRTFELTTQSWNYNWQADRSCSRLSNEGIYSKSAQEKILVGRRRAISGIIKYQLQVDVLYRQESPI